MCCHGRRPYLKGVHSTDTKIYSFPFFFFSHVQVSSYTLNSEPKALTGDKSEGIKSRGAAEAFIRGFSPVKAEGEEFNVLILSYTRELSRPFKENKG